MSIKYVGIIGWGATTKQIAKKLHLETKGTEVLALATTNKDGQDFGKNVLGLKHVFSDPYPLYELHQLNIIYICSSAEYHLEHTSKSLESGVDIILEFPMASNVTDCHSLEKVIRNHPSQKVLIGFPRRFDPYLQALQKQIKEGKIGHVLNVSVESYEALPKDLDVSKGYTESKGIFMDMTIEDIDMIRWISGQEFASVFAIGGAKKYPSLKRYNDADTAIITATLKDGVVVSFLSSRAGTSEDGYKITVTGTKGQLNYSTLQKQLTITSTDLVAKDININSQSKNHLAMVDYFLTNTLNGTRLPYKAAEGCEATKVAVAMTKSYVLNQIVNLDV